jgi:SSS family transporter
MRTGDWIVFAAYFVLVIAVALWKSRGSTGIDDYFLGKRSIPWWAAGLSVMATQASAITFIGTTGQAFNDGMRFIQIYLPLPIVVIILCATFVPFFYRARVYTAYEYLEKRFDAKTRALTSFLFQCSRAMGVGIILYAPSVVISVILEWDERYTILVMGITTLCYTALGGVRAVVWTDTLQMILMFGGIFVGLFLIAKGLPDGVGLSDAIYLGGEAGRLNAIEVSADLNNQYTILSGLVGGFFLMLSYFGCDQSQVQRYITARSLKESRMSLVMTGVLKVPMQFLILGTGVLLFVFFQFERPPVFFNPADVRKVEESAVRDEFLEKQARFDAAFERQRTAAAELINQRNAGRRAEADRAAVLYESARNEAAAIRSDTIKLVRATVGATSSDVNYVYPTFLVRYVPVGLLGLMISVIFAAAMSSISAEIAALSSASMIDISRRHFKREGSDRHYLRAGQVFTLMWGVFATIVAVYAGRFGASLVETVNKVGSHFYGPILGVFLLAFLVKRANGHGAFFGGILGMAAVVYVSWATQVSWLYYNVIGPLVVVVTGTLISLLWKARGNQPSP